jgi:hypothetical protein
MSIYFNGCSHTYGDELMNPSAESWPTLMSQSLNLEFKNDSVCGGSNERIVYKTISNLHNYDAFVVAWTGYSRFTEYNPVDNFEINFTPMLDLDASLQYSNDLKQNYSKYKNYGEMYYKHWFNDLYRFKQWLQQIIMLQRLFWSENKSYIMLNAFENDLSKWLSSEDKFIANTKHLLPFFDYLNDSQILEFYNEIQTLISMIDLTTFIGWNDWCIIKLRSDYPVGPGGHLLNEGHKQVAKIVTEKYNTLL